MRAKQIREIMGHPQIGVKIVQDKIRELIQQIEARIWLAAAQGSFHVDVELNVEGFNSIWIDEISSRLQYHFREQGFDFEFVFPRTVKLWWRQ